MIQSGFSTYYQFVCRESGKIFCNAAILVVNIEVHVYFFRFVFPSVVIVYMVIDVLVLCKLLSI